MEFTRHVNTWNSILVSQKEARSVIFNDLQ